jgi:tetratricopeptide (TPR) repeat protein
MLHYREALKLSPNDAQTRNNLGNVLAEEGHLDEAVTNYTEALHLKADNPEAHFNLGCVLVRLQQRDGAAEHFRAALQLNPNYEAAKEQLRVLLSAPRP